MTTIFYDEGGCGQGKTHRALQAIIEQGGRHIYACDRIETIRERARELRHRQSGRWSPEIKTIYSNHDYRTVGPSVSAQIEAVPEDYAQHPNLVVFITHEALKLANLDSFAGQGWSLWIDEVPMILDNDAHHFHLIWDKLDQLYKLDPLGETKWAEVRLRDPITDVAALALDDGLQVLRPMHRRVADPRRKVFADLNSFEQLRVPRRKMTWFSVWSPHELSVFVRVVMLGNDLMNSVTVRLLREHWPEVLWEPMLAPRRAFKPRRVFIHCFAEGHRASRSLFGSEQGKKNLREAARYIAGRVDPRNLLWTCNRPEKPLLQQEFGCEWLTPKKAGANDLSDRNHVAVLYTCKPDDSMRAVLAALGLKDEHYLGTNEHETMLQFVCRGSIREPNDQRDFHIYVYDRGQAEYLLTYFRERAADYVLWPDVEVVDLGFASEMRDSKRGPKTKVLTLAEQREREEKRREGNRLSQQRSREKAKAVKQAA